MMNLSKIIAKILALFLCTLPFYKGYSSFYLSHIIHEKERKYYCKI